MTRLICLILATAIQLPIAAVAGTCSRSNPAVTAVTLQHVSQTSHLNLYHVTATVTNLGNESQSGDVLQFIDVVQYDARLDDRGIPPLAPGQSYTVTYVWPRSADAGRLTSPLNFRIRTVAPADACSPTKGSAGIII
jgi:CARDB protein